MENLAQQQLASASPPLAQQLPPAPGLPADDADVASPLLAAPVAAPVTAAPQAASDGAAMFNRSERYIPPDRADRPASGGAGSLLATISLPAPAAARAGGSGGGFDGHAGGVAIAEGGEPAADGGEGAALVGSGGGPHSRIDTGTSTGSAAVFGPRLTRRSKARAAYFSPLSLLADPECFAQLELQPF